MKTQVAVGKGASKIICIFVGNGKKYDFKIFEESNTYINSNWFIAIVSEYQGQGLQKIHFNTA